MSKYRIVKHQAGKDIIGYSPEVWEYRPFLGWEYRPFLGECRESWWKLAGNEQLISQDRWIASLPKTMEEAKLIIEQHIEDSKPRYSEEVVYEFDTENLEVMKVPTAEKFFDTNYNGDIVEFAKEFAKMHVEEALKSAANNATITREEINKESILKSYPTNKIK